MKITKRKEELYMKKLVSLFLVLTLVFSLAVSASATDITNVPGEDHKAVEIVFNDNTAADVYKVVVTWGNMEFEYNKGTAGAWDPDTHEFAEVPTEGWVTNNNAKITVVNHSDAPVVVDAQFDTDANNAGDAYEMTTNGVTAALSKTAPTELEDASVSYSGVENKDNGPTVEITVSITNGVPTASFTLGTIYVAVSQPTP